MRDYFLVNTVLASILLFSTSAYCEPSIVCLESEDIHSRGPLSEIDLGVGYKGEESPINDKLQSILSADSHVRFLGASEVEQDEASSELSEMSTLTFINEKLKNEKFENHKWTFGNGKEGLVFPLESNKGEKHWLVVSNPAETEETALENFGFNRSTYDYTVLNSDDFAEYLDSGIIPIIELEEIKDIENVLAEFILVRDNCSSSKSSEADAEEDSSRERSAITKFDLNKLVQ